MNTYYTKCPRSDELYHFGVMGMKWGVRRYQNADGSLTAEGKKHYAYNGSYDKGFVLKKGTKVGRVSMTEDETEEGRTFAAFKQDDIDHYIENGKMINEMLGTSSYSYTYVTKENLKFPSRKEKVDAYISLIDSDPKFATLFNKNITKKSRAKQEASFDKFEMNKLSVRNNKRAEKYYAELKRRGYNAMLDDADMKQKISEMPIIVLDRGKSLSLKSIEEIDGPNKQKHN